MSPIYSYECAGCGAKSEEIRCIADRDKGPKCILCEKRMPRVPDAPHGVVKNPAVPKKVK